LECESEEEIERVVSKTTVDFWYKQTLFNSDHFDSTVIADSVQSIHKPLVPGVAQAKFFNIRKTETLFYDEWFGFDFFGKKSEFLSIVPDLEYMRDSTHKFFDEEPWYLAIWFVQDA
jgi:hypothetical protein